MDADKAGIFMDGSQVRYYSGMAIESARSKDVILPLRGTNDQCLRIWRWCVDQAGIFMDGRQNGIGKPA